MQFVITEDEFAQLRDSLDAGPAAERQDALLALAWHARQRDTPRALAWADEAEAAWATTPRHAGSHAALACARARLQLVRGEAAVLKGDPADALARAAQALDIFTTHADTLGQADAHWLLAVAAGEGGDMARRDAEFEACTIAAARAGDSQRHGIAEGARARWSVMRDLAAAEARWQDRFSRELPELPGVVTWAFDYLGAVAFGHGDFGRATMDRVRMIEDAMDTGQVQRAIVAQMNIGACFGNLHDYETALVWIERALQASRRCEWPASVASCLMQVGAIYRLMGRLDAAHDVITEALGMKIVSPASRTHALLMQYLGEVLNGRGDHEGALVAYRELEARGRSLDQIDLLICAQRGQASALAATGRADDALKVAREGVALTFARGNKFEQIEDLVSMADILARRHEASSAGGAEPEAIQALERALAIAATIDGFTVPGHLLDALARQHALAGDHARAYATAVQASEARERTNSAAAVNRSVAMQITQQTERAVADAQHHRALAQAQAERASVLQATTDTLQRLSEIGREITAHLDSGAIVEALDRHVHGLLDATYFAVYVLSPDGQKLVGLSGREDGRPIALRDVPLAESTANAARSARERLEIVRHVAPPGFNPNHIPGTLITQSALFAPLTIGDRLLGVMSIQTPRTHAYGERELLVFRTLCAYGAIGLDNAAAYRQVAATLVQLREAQAQLEDQNRLLEQAHDQQQEASLTDPLTGLRNRRFLLQHIDVETALAARRHLGEVAPAPDVPAEDCDMAFFLIDVDHFKAVNDRHGHSAGDAVLAQMGDRLRKAARETDYIIRWGGEEFLLVARMMDRRKAAAVAERLRLAVADEPFDIGNGVQLAKTCSVGYSCFPWLSEHPDSLSWSEVVDLADQALYLAKRGGRDTWVGLQSAPGTDPRGLHRRLVADLGAAVEAGWLQVESRRPVALAAAG